LCPACGRSWPVRSGVPRFFQDANYWGEIPAVEAGSLAEQARRIGWRKAVAEHFRDSREMQVSLLDWQRAAWAPLLGLGPDSLALDIGSGYGAITHALSFYAGQVYSLEAVGERIEFTRTRLEQEGIRNVQLLQGSALALPFPEGMFDAIIVNGVLEWVGEWDTSRAPRRVQLEFLQKLARLLKSGGTLMIGIENRLSYDTMRGLPDHSGLRYTNLLPRRLATFCLRHARGSHYRTSLNEAREYRTYTYTERGYRKLLKEGGFGAADFFWPYPGYNQPYSVVPLDRRFVRGQLLANLSDPFLRRHGGWSQRLKRAAAALGVFAPVVPDYLIFAARQRPPAAPGYGKFGAQLAACQPRLPAGDGPTAAGDRPRLSLYTGPFSKKTVLRIFAAEDSAPALIVKASTPAPDSQKEIEVERANLALAQARCHDRPEARVQVPRPGAAFRLGRCHCAVESAVSGEPVSRLLFLCPATRRFDFLSRWLLRCAASAVEIAKALHGEHMAPPLDESWREPPDELGPGLQRITTEASGPAGSYADWVQHGDFTSENLFFDSRADQFAVIDWQHLVRGAPPLYDLLSFLLSILHAIPPPEFQTQDGLPPGAAAVADQERRLLSAFFAPNRWSALFRKAVHIVGDALEVAQDAFWPMFLETLIIRTNFHASRNSSFAAVHKRYLQIAAANREAFLLH
jgi:SAM-dependent methyltransferase